MSTTSAPLPECITVVIPTFNRREWLQRAVESVLVETRIPIKLRIFDNASTDGTESYVTALMAADPRVHYVRNASNIGATPNYIQALASVDTEYFVPLADDDWLLPDFLFEAWNIMHADAELGAAVFVTEARNQANEVQNRYPMALDSIRFGKLTPHEHVTDWLNHGHYAWSSILWRRKARDVVGYPYLVAGLPSDVDFQLQAFCHFPVHMDRRAGAVYSLHANQASGAYDQRELLSWARVFARLDRTVAQLGLFTRSEYLALRRTMQWRYRGMWVSPPPEPMAPERAARAAVRAGLQLGDWDTAWSLAGPAAPAGETPGHATALLPALGQMDEREVLDRTGADTAPVLLAVVRWFGLARAALAQSQAELAEVRQLLAAAQHQLADAQANAQGAATRMAALQHEFDLQASAQAQRETAAREELAHLEAARNQLSETLATIQNSRLHRWLRVLGLLRLPAKT